ncbi:MAG: NAD(P)-dependent alcohol dehydrogenase [Chromatiales bacterium]|nr:NAD(P)-dependent alcohol dehydrogenase [Chromatiales bacterium]
MKAVLFTQYGTADSLHYAEVTKPTPERGEVLVKVRAASINSWDWELLRGIPFANRLSFGLLRPTRIQSLGCDVAGVVEEVGSEVTQFKPGDAVYGDLSHEGWGGFAEYLAAPVKALSLKPDFLSFEQAAAVPQAGLLAWMPLCGKGHIPAGTRVLINGASGGAGSFAVQIARALGAEVTGVCRGEKVAFVRSLGADHVIDYVTEDFTRNAEQYDLILDMRATHSLADYRRALSPTGRYIMEGGESFRILQAILYTLLDKRRFSLLLHKPNRGLTDLEKMLESGQVKPIIDRIFPLSETVEAMRYFADGRTRGKVVICVCNN